MDEARKHFISAVSRGVWLYGVSLVNNLVGFVYWLAILGIASKEIVGETSATVGLALVLSGLLSLGLSMSVKRFLGESIGKGDVERTRRIYWSTIYMVFMVSAGGLAVLLAVAYCTGGFMGYSFEKIAYASLLAFLTSHLTSISIYISMLRTLTLFKVNLVANIAKLVLGLTLVYIGLGWVGAYLGYVLQYLILLLASLIYTVHVYGFTLEIDWGELREIVVAGLANWIPSTITILGQWLGVVVLYGAAPSSTVGEYYIVFLIANFITYIGVNLVNMMLPLLPRIEGGREDVVRRVLVFTYTIIIPVAIALIMYPDPILSLFNMVSQRASTALRLLLASAFPQLLISASIGLLYSYNSYRRVLSLGLLQNLPRIILYITLSPVYGAIGTAASYTIGSYIAVGYALALGTRYHYLPIDRRLLYSLAFSIAVPAIVYYLSGGNGLAYILSIPLVYMVLIASNTVSREDLRLLLANIFRE